MLIISFLISWGVVIINNPFLLTCLFIQVLIVMCCLLRFIRKFMSFIFFLIYVGGLVILLRYCVILTPMNKFTSNAPLYPVLALFLIGDWSRSNSFTFGLLFSASSVFLVALILYLVMLRIVTIVDYSRGLIKIYVPSSLLWDVKLFANRLIYSGAVLSV